MVNGEGRKNHFQKRKDGEPQSTVLLGENVNFEFVKFVKHGTDQDAFAHSDTIG